MKVVRIYQHIKFQAIPSMCSPENDQTPQIWPVKFFGLCDLETYNVTLKGNILFHLTRWMVSVNFMKFEGKL